MNFDPGQKPKEMQVSTRIITVPNIMSVFRLCLIPLFIWLYCAKENIIAATGVLLLSGATDVADGYVARHFNMISELGKALDPMADKLTQASVLVVLIMKHRIMLILFMMLFIKEVFVGTTELMILRRTGKVSAARWHGKAATVALFITMFTHIVWRDIPKTVSIVMVCVCSGVMIMSLILYGVRHVAIIKGGSIDN